MDITFYPGPSKVYPQVREFMLDAFDEGIVQLNHRSSSFMEICRKAIEGIKQKLNVPEGYSVMFTSSATEGWEIVSQSLTTKKSFHLYNGAFGKKWLEYARKIHPQAAGQRFELEESLPVETIAIPENTEVVCLTQNETSNGTQVRNEVMRQLRKRYPAPLIAVDATSSLGGIALDFTTADVWLGSVQKCFGLPPGLGIMICSPRAIERARQIGDRTYYNSLLFVHENFVQYQTPYTPNVLGIYLLMRVMEMRESIQVIEKSIRQQAAEWYAFLGQQSAMQPLVQSAGVRSDTVITVATEPNRVTDLKEKAKQRGITLGNGYGDWKSSTFRIANFPAITREEIAILKEFLKEC